MTLFAQLNLYCRHSKNVRRIGILHMYTSSELRNIYRHESYKKTIYSLAMKDFLTMSNVGGEKEFDGRCLGPHWYIGYTSDLGIRGGSRL